VQNQHTNTKDLNYHITTVLILCINHDAGVAKKEA
jgi:hypothetical protein